MSPGDSAAAPPHVLYIAYWGAGEPLGQSLVLPSIRRLAVRGVRFTLVTFDKPADADNRPLMSAIGADLREAGVRWIPLRYHKRPRLPATTWDVFQGWSRSIAASRRGRPDLVHGRTYVGGVIGRLVASTLSIPFVYHNEGFYPDEQVDGGFWPAGSAMHRTTRAIESGLYDSAQGLVALSHRARAVLESRPAVSRRSTPVIVVPSCVDMETFRPGAPRTAGLPLRLVYVGAVGGRYRLDEAARFVAVAREAAPVEMTVLSRADPRLVEQMIGDGGLPKEAWSLRSVPHGAMPAELAQHDAGLFFLARGTSEHGCSPTKVGEYWATGRPVVTTRNVSDLDDIIARHRVGVMIEGPTDDHYRDAFRRLQELLRDPELPRRCRTAAEEHYALDPACERLLALYHQIARSRGAA